MFLLESDGVSPTRSRLHPFAMFITAFDMGGHDVLQVLGRCGQVNAARTPPRPAPSAKESNCALRTPFEPGCVLHERGRIAACRCVAAEGILVVKGKRCYADPPCLHAAGGAVFPKAFEYRGLLGRSFEWKTGSSPPSG